MKFLLLCILFVVDVYGRQGFGPGEQDWGYVTVRPGGHMFWWLYYTTANVTAATDRPVLIWLQGGPGAASTGYGNFAELGPLDVNLEKRNYTWVKDANVLFIDNPVGTGFSYVETSTALTTTNKQIAEDLVELLRGFYAELPKFKTVPLYILSESYGGKMAAEFALELDQAIKAGTIESNFIGVGIGDSWVSPIDSVLTWAPFLLHIGAVDQQGYEKVNAAALKTKEALDNGEYAQATTEWSNTEYVVMDVAHNVDFYNVIKEIPSYSQLSQRKLALPSVRDEDDEKIDAIMKGPVKEALGLNVTFGAQSSAVFRTLREDFMKPATEIVESLLNTTDVKVFVYSGQLDLICDTLGNLIWIDNLQWKNSTQWKTAYRYALTVDGINEGYVKSVENLSFYWVNRAGHMVPADNPPAMDGILRALTENYSGTVQRK